MNQKILNGISHLREALEGATKVFLVCDSSFPFLNIKDDIENMGIPHVMFSDFTPNPVYEDVCKGIDLFQITKCNSILAVGGGSAIDVAKCIKLAVLAKDGNSALIPPLVNTRVECDGSKIPFIAIPTTAGTGSESTHNAVMYYEGAKQTVTNDRILPDVAMLEPSVLKSLPLYQKKCTMMDALCQGIESWWSVNSTEESYEYSRKTIQLIMDNWRKYIFENDDEAAVQIMLAANYGGRAINITQTTAAHAFSYKITSLYKLPHGHAVAVCLPEIWEYMLEHMDKCIDKRGLEYLARIFDQISKTMRCERSKDAIDKFKEMMEDMELGYPVAENKEEELEVLSISVNPVRLKNNPVHLNETAILNIYEVILH
jgi:alcohol dehydrogenase class IV